MDSETQAASLLSKSSPTENEIEVNDKTSSSNGSIIHINGGTDVSSHVDVDVDVDADDDEGEGGYVSGKEEFEDSDLKKPIVENKSLDKEIVGVDASDPSLDSLPILMLKVSTPVTVDAGDDTVEKDSQGAPVIESEESEIFFLPEEGKLVKEEIVHNAVADLSPVDVSNESGIGEDPSKINDVTLDLAPTTNSVASQPIPDETLGSMENQEQNFEEPKVDSSNDLFDGSDTIQHVKDENAVESTVEGDSFKPDISSARETVNVSEAGTAGTTRVNKDTELEVEAPVMLSSVPSNEREQDSHEIEKFLEELMETDLVAKDSASDLVAVDDLGEFQPGGGATEDLGSIQEPGQFFCRVEDVPTEVVLDNGTDSENAVLDYAATEGDGVDDVATKEGSAVGSADTMVHNHNTPKEEASAAEEVLAQKSISELVVPDGALDDNIRTSTVTTDYGSVREIIGDPESEPSEAVLEISDDENTDIPEGTEAISERSVGGAANTASLKGFHMKLEAADEGEFDGSVSDGETDDMIFGSSEAAKQFIDELEHSGAGSHTVIDRSSYDQSDRMDGQIVTDSDEEVETDGEEEGKELFDSAALAALLKAASSAGSDGGNITITSQDGSRLFSIERPAGLGSSGRPFRPVTRPTHPNIFPPSNLARLGESEDNLSEEEKNKLEKVQALRVKFLRIVQRMGVSSDESIAAQVLYRLAVIAGRQAGQNFSLDSAKRTATELEAEGKDDLDFSVNVLIVGKSGVGKSATINSIFGEERASINAFEPATAVVKEVSGVVNGVTVKVFDTPGLKPGVMEQAFNRRVLSSINLLTKKSPPDIILYVDRLDTQTRDLNDLPLLKTITSSLGTPIWKNAIITLTHAASAPPEGPSGSPLSYEMFVTQRSHVLQQCIGHAVGDLRMMSPSLMNAVSLVENHPSCRKNRDGQKVLPNGQTWRSQLLLLCFSMKMLADANSLTKSQDPFDNRRLFGFRTRSPPLPYMLSSMLQSRPHPKLQTDQGIDNGDSDNELADLSDIEEEEEDEYDQLPPFKPLRKSQLAKLSREQRNAYFEEYDYRVKLLQKNQWKEELRRMRDMKKKGKTPETDYGFNGEDDQDAIPAPVATPLPDMALPPSFDSGSPAYRYRFLEPTSQFLARPVLDTHGWDHDCGYDGVNIEHALAILSQFPAAVSLQMTKDKKEFSLHFDSSVAAKHGDNGSSMLGFDIQNIGKQLAYIVRGETKFKTLKRNKTAAGMSVTFLGENTVTGFKAENQVAWGKQWAAVTSAGTVRCQNEAAYGANIEVQRREIDYPVGQVQSTYGVSLIRWRGDWALGFNTMAQFSAGRNSKVAVRAGINNKMSGQVTVRTSSSEQLVLALAGLLPIVTNIYKKIWPAVGGENYSIY